MSLFSRLSWTLSLCCMVGVVSACGDARRADIKAEAHAWVDRLHDTTKADTVATPFADSAFVDSLAAAFTTDDWLYFWHEVEEEQALRGKEKSGS